MKILMVNNRLKVYGGEGTYMTSLGDEFIRHGHDVQYFGLKDSDNLYGNDFDIYAKKSINPFKLIKNDYNRKQFAKILDAFKPDIVHANLLYFTLTPSILAEAKKRNIKVVMTVHDGKIVCPSYQLYIKAKETPCKICVSGDYKNCVKFKCHKNSKFFSYIAYREAKFNRKKKYYDLIDKFIFPSNFMRELHVESGISSERTLVLCNFSRVNKRTRIEKAKKKYVLYCGRITKVKGMDCLISAIKKLPDVNFVIAGKGDMENEFAGLSNCRTVGFKSGAELEELIAGAVISVVPSVWYENCPMSILESFALGTPVIGSKIGGIPELITDGETGYVFESGNFEEMANLIKKIYDDTELSRKTAENCLRDKSVLSAEEYAGKILGVYRELLVK